MDSFDDEDSLIPPFNSVSSSGHHPHHYPRSITAATSATKFGLGQVHPTQDLDSEDYIYTTINPLLTISHHHDHVDPHSLPPPIHPGTSLNPDDTANIVPDVQEDIFDAGQLPSAAYNDFSYGSIFGNSLNDPINIFTLPTDDEPLGQLGTGFTSNNGAAVGFQPMPPPAQSASALRSLQQPRQPIFHFRRPMHFPIHYSLQKPFDPLIDPNMGLYTNPYTNTRMHFPTQTVRQPMHKMHTRGIMPNLVRTREEEEVEEKMRISAEIAARFPPEMIPVNYTTAPEANLDEPFDLTKLLGEEPAAEPGVETDVESWEGDQGRTQPASSMATSATKGSSPRAQDPHHSGQRCSRATGSESLKNHRRVDYVRRKRELMKRRYGFLGLRERHQMYYVQDVRNHCRSSGLEDPENPWLKYNFEAELKAFRNIGKSLMEPLSEVPELPEQDSHASPSINHSTVDRKSRASTSTAKGATKKTDDSSAKKKLSVSAADRLKKEQEDRDQLARYHRACILRSIPRALFNTKLLDPLNPDIGKPGRYLDFIRKIHRANIRPCLKYFLYRELDSVQSTALNEGGSAALADRISSLEWDIRDYMKKGEVRVTQNIRVVVRDYRAGFIKLPQEGSCILYHDGKLLGHFKANRLLPFLYPFLGGTAGPVWKEDGNQPKPVPEVYMRAYAQMFPQDSLQFGYDGNRGYCRHGRPVDRPQTHGRHSQ
ncbi:hypothetical protein TWF569_004447 [Orbilia oligospora]|uniref:Uncharacterized protein n=1 Tax=Orbilia oligospora TaxID=2813651 RepID=A0A7C8JUT5_ORBOL|nr:hypothetical protein TWF569_004447 [Orbilia oligospora]KAF3123776.1 hypothetical protein TWF594_002207 [Orbilia oligospora]KAF3142886.1 hypothetical protein TWF703_000390 [Orbilia oligospora]